MLRSSPARASLATLACIASGLLFAACDRDAGDDSAARTVVPAKGGIGTEVPLDSLAQVLEITELLVAGGRALYMDQASRLAVEGTRLALLFPRSAEIATYDLASGMVRVVGRPGEGPGDIPPLTSDVAINAGGDLAFAASPFIGSTVAVLDSSGSELARWRLDHELAPIDRRLALDGRGHAFVATWPRAPALLTAPGAPQPESLFVVIHRLGIDNRDSAALAPLRSARPLTEWKASSVTVIDLPHTHTFRGDVGRLYWQVDSGGLIYIARGDRWGVDTVRIGGSLGPLISDQPVDRRVLTRDQAAQVLGRLRTLTPEQMAALGPVQTTTVTGLWLTDRELWIKRPQFDAAGSLNRDRSFYDVHDHTGRLVRRVSAPDLDAVGARHQLRIRLPPGRDESVLQVLGDRASPPSPAIRGSGRRSAEGMPVATGRIVPPPVDSAKPQPTSPQPATPRPAPVPTSVSISCAGRPEDAGGIVIEVVFQGSAPPPRGAVAVNITASTNPLPAASLSIAEVGGSGCRGAEGGVRFTVEGAASDSLTVQIVANTAVAMRVTAGTRTLLVAEKLQPGTRHLLRWSADPSSAPPYLSRLIGTPTVWVNAAVMKRTDLAWLRAAVKLELEEE